MDRRKLLIVLVTLGLLVLAFVPAAVTFGLGWLRLPAIRPGGAPPAPDPTTPEAWALFAVLYLLWMVGLAVLLVWLYDRLDYHWRYHERAPRPGRERRRRTAGLALLEGRETARRAAERRPPRAPGGR